MNFGNNKLMKNVIIALEKYITIFISVSLMVALYFNNVNIIELNDSNQLFSNITNFVSIMLGILITMATLFLGYANKQVVKTLKIKNAHKLIFKYFLLPISTGLILAIGTITIATLVSQKIIISDHGRIITSIYGGILSIFLVSSVRILLLMLMILKEVFKEDTIEDNTSSDSENSTELHFDEDVF